MLRLHRTWDRTHGSESLHRKMSIGSRLIGRSIVLMGKVLAPRSAQSHARAPRVATPARCRAQTSMSHSRSASERGYDSRPERVVLTFRGRSPRSVIAQGETLSRMRASRTGRRSNLGTADNDGCGVFPSYSHLSCCSRRRVGLTRIAYSPTFAKSPADKNSHTGVGG